jgi:hypothetical protein
MSDNAHRSRGRRDDAGQGRDTKDEELQLEYERDRIVSLIGNRSLTATDPEHSQDARFLDWWARELRDRASASTLTARAEAFERRMRATIVGRECHVELPDGPVPCGPPRVEGTVAGIIREATALRCAPSLDLGVAAGVGRDLWDEPCTSWVELPEHVQDGQHVALTVTGESMEPLLYAGDTILVKLGVALRRGAIVVARRPDDGYVVKRVGRIGPRVVELTSLHPGFGAIRIPRRDDLILGTVIMRWSAHAAATTS